MIGKTILHYRVLKEIGKGGMGVVYKAEDTKLNRTVAIKALSAELIGDQKARARFLREARAASAIDHPNICTVYEINEVDGTLFFVMQFVEGKTLKKLVSGRPLPLEQALDISLELADALVEAHRRQVIHRDIKSSNIILNERGQAKILDFGLAKFVEAARGDGAEAVGITELTQAGSPFGTANYMSPEQARGEVADARSDIFSLGVVMYEMFTGRLPFAAKTSVDVMHKVMHSEPEAMGPASPPALQQVISKALAKDLAARYQTAEELLEALRALVRGHYAEQSAVPADRAASLRAAKPSKPRAERGVLSRFANWARQALAGKNPDTEDSSVTPSVPTDMTPSMWRSSDKKAIAILPFKNLSGSPETDFYSFSLADSVITELAQLHDLIVRPSSYIVQFQNRDVDPRDIGIKLAVDAVLACGYIKSGDRFRVTPQLVDIRSGEIMWSDKIDVDAKDIITVQDKISRQIVEGLRVRTTSLEQERMVKLPTESAEAYEIYLKGRTLLYRFITHTLDIHDLESAVESFAKAVELDAGFALAHSGLGIGHLNYVLKGIGGAEYYKLAKEAFDRALALEPTLVEPRVRLIYIDLIEGASDVARTELRRLLRRAPNEPSVHSAAAYVYRLSGQYDLALREWDQLLRVSPGDIVFAAYNRARIYIYQGEYRQAEEELNRGLASEPNHALLRSYGAVIDYHQGEVDKAISTLEDVMAKNPDLHSYRLFLAFCYRARGEPDRAFDLLDDKVIASAHADQDVAYWLASLYASTGRTEDALEWLERSISMGNENYPWIAKNSMWDPLRGEPRFSAVLDDLRSRWERLQEGSS
jgi:serine/threonine protein kinase